MTATTTAHDTLVVLGPELADRAPALARRAVVVVLEPGLGGAWTEQETDGTTWVRFGLTPAPASEWLAARPPRGNRHNVLSIALERILYSHQLSRLLLADAAAAGNAPLAVANLPGVRAEVPRPGEAPVDFLARQGLTP